MPPKRKTAAAKKIQKKVVTKVQVETTVEAPDAQAQIEQTSVKRKHSETVEEEEEEEPQDQASQVQEPQAKQAKSEPSSSSLSDRMAKLKELKRRRVSWIKPLSRTCTHHRHQATEVDQGNRRDRNLEFQRSKENPKLEARDERKKAEALKLLEKQEAEDKGEDYERKQFWKYSAESAAAWEKKMAKKAKMANHGFTDHSQAAHKKYIRLMSEFKPDMGAYTEKRMLDIERAIRNGEDPSDISAMANSLDYARLDDKPSKEAVDRLAEETKKQYVDLQVVLCLVLTLFLLEFNSVRQDLVIAKSNPTTYHGSTKRIVSSTKRLQDSMTSTLKKFAKISKEVQLCKWNNNNKKSIYIHNMCGYKLYFFFNGGGTLHLHITNGGSDPLPLKPAVVCFCGLQVHKCADLSLMVSNASMPPCSSAVLGKFLLTRSVAN